MNIALLNERITIQRNSTIIDNIGNHLPKFVDYYSCAATVSNELGTETEDTAVTVDNSKLNFTVRFCEETAHITPLDCRVIHRGELYDILCVDHMNYKRKCIKLHCQKARR